MRGGLDAWFPTVVRYVGLALLIYAVTLRRDLASNPAFWPAVAGLVMFKFVVGDGKKE